MAKKKTSLGHIWNDVIVVLFSLVSILLLFLELNDDVTARQVVWIHYFDIAVAVFFLFEFLYRFKKAQNRRAFLTFHWWELLACIPVSGLLTQSFRGIRVLRVLEIAKVLRTSARLEVTGEIFGGLTEHPYLIEAVATMLAIIFGSAVGFYVFEAGRNPGIHSLWDAFWWSASTLTTTGYGDIYPFTTAGRVLALVLMFTGLVSITFFTATVVRYASARRRKH